MKDETSGDIHADRLDTLLRHPETVTPEELEEWLDDDEFLSLYATAMDVRRAELGRDTHVDVRAELRAFRRWSMRTADPDPQPRRKRVLARLLPWLTAAAAALITVLVMTLTDKERQPDRQGDIMVYRADNELNDVALIIGSDTLDLNGGTAKSKARLGGITCRGGKELVYPSALRQGGTNTTHTVALPNGKTFQLTLPDGTHVWLNADSRLSYPDAFSGRERVVELQGEAYFDVRHDEAHPFIVKCGKVSATVLGTTFNIRQYGGEAPRVTLIEGKVGVTANGQTLTLGPGQTATISPKGQLGYCEADVQGVTCWREGEFYFDNMPLCDIMTELGRWYKMDVVFKRPRHLSDMLHFHAERDWPLGDVIKQINYISSTKIHVNGNSLVVE